MIAIQTIAKTNKKSTPRHSNHCAVILISGEVHKDIWNAVAIKTYIGAKGMLEKQNKESE